VGTTNALQSVQISHGVNGIIADTDEELVQWAFKFLEDKEFRQRISLAGKAFAKANYSLEATFGMLSKYFTYCQFD
jgi:glycosyltransferase involved in cell wall biosynthesis